ncbi:hypothetical protein [Thauera sp. Sel9]|uniref:hypothetical protein n=1 Tax=Thauera sp. Sel9 TaxID=2974299 RepID=UPI003FA38100
MNHGEPLEADAQSPKAVQPSQVTLDDPANRGISRIGLIETPLLSLRKKARQIANSIISVLAHARFTKNQDAFLAAQVKVGYAFNYDVYCLS